MPVSARSNTRILIACPGAGLGHLVRAASVAMELEKLGNPVKIVTHSLYAQGLAMLTGLSIDFIPAPEWTSDLPQYAANLDPRLVVLDTFPWGIRGEWKGRPAFRYVFLARLMKPEAYLEAAGLKWDEDAPQLQRVIAVEPLGEYGGQFTMGEFRCCDDRIRFPVESATVPIPEKLDRLLKDKRIWLVVHSGPNEEIDRLIHIAEKDAARQGGGQVVIIAPKPLNDRPYPVFEYFPAAGLYEKAFRVVTGAGYNAVAEAAPNPDKHILMPFHRRYDDQATRLEDFHRRKPGKPTNGAEQAAGFIAEWL